MLRVLIVGSPAPDQLRPALAKTYGSSAVEALPLSGTGGELADAVIGVIERHGFDPGFLAEWYQRAHNSWVQMLTFAAGLGIPLGDPQSTSTESESKQASGPSSTTAWIIVAILAVSILLVCAMAIWALVSLGRIFIEWLRA